MPPLLKKIIIVIYAVCIAAGFIIWGYMSGRTAMNPDGVTGNTAGNLYNNGMFCEYNGRIYFANPYDNNTLYSMRSDCTDIKKLGGDSVSGINVYGKYIFYIKNNSSSASLNSLFRGQLLGVMRCDLNGRNDKTLYDTVAGVIALYGNNLYYQRYSKTEDLTFYRIGIDGKNEQRLSDFGYYPASFYNGSLYYSNTEGNHDIYTFDTVTGAISPYLTANTYMVDMQGDYIYYIDLDDSYSLVRVNTSTRSRDVLYDGSLGKCIAYNLYDNVIFFHVEGDSPALYRINADGSGLEYIKYGNITNISCTSQYTFFQIFGTTSLYRVPTNGPVNVELVTMDIPK